MSVERLTGTSVQPVYHCWNIGFQMKLQIKLKQELKMNQPESSEICMEYMGYGLNNLTWIIFYTSPQVSYAYTY